LLLAWLVQIRYVEGRQEWNLVLDAIELRDYQPSWDSGCQSCSGCDGAKRMGNRKALVGQRDFDHIMAAALLLLPAQAAKAAQGD
jgi:hypothetical protein